MGAAALRTRYTFPARKLDLEMCDISGVSAQDFAEFCALHPVENVNAMGCRGLTDAHLASLEGDLTTLLLDGMEVGFSAQGLRRLRRVRNKRLLEGWIQNLLARQGGVEVTG